MNGGNWILFLIVAFALVVVGFFVFPDLYTQATSANTTAWLPLTAGTHSLIPFGFLAAIIFGVYLIFKGKGNNA